MPQTQHRFYGDTQSFRFLKHILITSLVKGAERMVPEVRDMYAGIFKALAHPKRIKIIELLERHGKMCVCEIVAQSQIEQPSVSKHLNILKNAGIIESEKQGLNVKCWLKTPEVSKLLAEVREILKKGLESRQAVFSKKQ